MLVNERIYSEVETAGGWRPSDLPVVDEYVPSDATEAESTWDWRPGDLAVVDESAPLDASEAQAQVQDLDEGQSPLVSKSRSAGSSPLRRKSCLFADPSVVSRGCSDPVSRSSTGSTATVDADDSGGITGPPWRRFYSEPAPIGQEPPGESLRARRRLGSLTLKASRPSPLPPPSALEGQAAAVVDLEALFGSGCMLGEGSFSSVTRVVRRSDSKVVALKTTKSDDVEVIAIARREYEILKQLDHPHIVKAFDFMALSAYKVVLVMEYFDGAQLEDVIRRTPEKCLDDAASRVLARMLMSAVAYLHQRGIAHRDVNPKNVLMSNDAADLRLIDFNVASRYRDGLLTPTGNRFYAAPELLRGGSPSQATDVWGVGLCLHLMLTGVSPKVTEDSCLLRRGKRWKPLPAECRELLVQCLHSDEASRPLAEVASRSPWLVVED